MIIRPNAIWGDVFDAGAGLIGCAYDEGNFVHIDYYKANEEFIERDILEFPERLLFVRAERNLSRAKLVCGMGHQTGKFYIKGIGISPANPDLTCYGTHPADILWRPTNFGFHYVCQVSPSQYYDSEQERLRDIPFEIHGTSQGIIQLESDGPRWADAMRALVPDMFFPFELPRIIIGEGRTDPAHIAALDGSKLKKIYLGIAERPRAVLTGNNILAIATRGPEGVKFLFFTLPLPDLSVDSIPEPGPTPEPEPMPLPNYLESVTKVANAFPKEFADCHRVELGYERYMAFIRRLASYLHYGNAVLKISPDSRIGLNGKRGTDELSMDALSFNDNGTLRVIDVVAGAGGPNPSPAWAEVGGVSKWFKPPVFEDVITPPPPPPPPPPLVYKPIHIDDNELTTLFLNLEKKYSAPNDLGGLNRPSLIVHVDPLGFARWSRDYFVNRDRGMNAQDSWKDINRKINQIVGIPGDKDPND